MREKGFRRYLQDRGLNVDAIDSSVRAIAYFEKYLRKKRRTLKTANLSIFKEYIALLMKEGKNSEDRLVTIARYCYCVKKNDFYIYLVSILGATNVLPDIAKRIASIAGDETRRRIYDGIEFPPLGAAQEEYPELTKTVLDRMETEMSPEKCREIMTWNYHQVPAAVFEEAKKRFAKSKSIDAYLKDEHRRLVDELERHMKKGQLWYEQEITPEVLEFVRNNQEINTGLRRGDEIFKVKIPYAPKQFLKEQNPTMKKYYACHCQLVRTAIRDGKPKISPTFCYCSAGYEKLHFDVIFGEPVKVKILETLLKGDPCCRFSIKIPKKTMKL